MLTELAKEILKQAEAFGATSADVSLSEAKGFSVTVRMGKVETIEHHQDRGVSLTVYLGHKTGMASTTDFDSEAIKATVNKAYSIAKYTEEDEYAGLADANLLAKRIPDLDLFHPWEITPTEAVEVAKECEEFARAQDVRITNSEGATVNTCQTHYIYANTHHFMGEMKTTRHSIDINLIAKEKGEMERDYDYTVARDANDLMSIKNLAKNTAYRTVKRLSARKLKTQKTPVIFEARLARGLLAHFIDAISGSRLYRKSSFLLDHLNKQVFPKFMTIDQRPLILKGLNSSAYDDEGVQTVERQYVESGILKSYVLNSYSARKLGLQTTGNAGGIYNLFVNTSNRNLDDLIKQIDAGLLVTKLIGQGVNIMTGDYSRGAFGYWIEQGEIQYPVHEITIAGNLKDMFLGIQSIAHDVDTRGAIRTGSILVDQMTIAGE